MSDSAIVESYDKIPRHIAMIMDGNGRWAKSKSLPRTAGHRKGVETVKKIIPACGERGIRYLTLFAFSSENWKRPPTEVGFLMELLTTMLEEEVMVLHENKIKLRVIGDLSRFSDRLAEAITQSVELTRENDALNLTIAINYGSRWEMIEACRAIAEQVAKGEIPPSEVSADLVESKLATHDIPDPDLLIRTGGVQRISNFLLWQLAYTELYFSEIHWPDFDEQALEQALLAFAKRQRRFGKIDEQVKVSG